MLFAVLVTLGGLILRAVRRRWKVAPLKVEVLLPDLQTDVRVPSILRRIFRDPDQGVYLAEATVGGRKLTFCATDRGSDNPYEASRTAQDFALYALGTLQAGGAEAMRTQITDIDTVVEPLADLTRFVQAGQFPNDYAVIGGRVVSYREAVLNGEPVRVYRTRVEKEAERELLLDIAVEPNGEPPFSDDALVHGSARLYGSQAG